MFMPNFSKLIGIASISLILCACGGDGDGTEGSKLATYDDSEVVLDGYDDSVTKLDGYDDSETRLDDYDDSETKLDGYDDSGSVLDGYDDSESALDSFLDGEPGNTWGSGGSGGSGGGDGGGNGNAPDVDYMNCSNLSPNDVYFNGEMGKPVTGPGGPADADGSVIINVNDPSAICVGLPHNAGGAQVTQTGEIIYSIHLDGELKIMEMDQDELTRWDNNTRWAYPDDPMANDTELFSIADDAINIQINERDIFYKRINDNEQNIYSNGDIYYTHDTNINIVRVLPNNSLLIEEYFADEVTLVIIDGDLNRTDLTMPETAPDNLDVNGVTKLHIDSTTGNQSLWFLTSTGIFDPIYRRWSLDLTTNIITGGEEFAPRLDPENSYPERALLDGNGDLIQIIWQNGGTDDYRYIVKRPHLSSGGDAIKLHSEEDYLGSDNWQLDPTIFAHLSESTSIFTFQ